MVERGPARRGRARATAEPGLLSRFVPAPLRAMLDEIDERTARIPTRLNEYGYDPFGFDPASMRYSTLADGLDLPALPARRGARRRARAARAACC